MASIGRIWFILAYCHSYWQNMQPIKSVLPFCSALPIQYTPIVTVFEYLRDLIAIVETDMRERDSRWIDRKDPKKSISYFLKQGIAPGAARRYAPRRWQFDGGVSFRRQSGRLCQTMDLKIAADLCPSAGGSAVRTSPVQAALIGNESVPKNIINSTVSLFFLNCNQHFGNFKP